MELYDLMRILTKNYFSQLRDVHGELLTEDEASEAKAYFMAELERHTEGYEGM